MANPSRDRHSPPWGADSGSSRSPSRFHSSSSDADSRSRSLSHLFSSSSSPSSVWSSGSEEKGDCWSTMKRTWRKLLMERRICFWLWQMSSQEKQTGVIDTESFVQIVMTPRNGFVKVPSLYERVRAAFVDISELDNVPEGMSTLSIQSPTDDFRSDSCLSADIGTRDGDCFDSKAESKFDLQKHNRGDESSCDGSSGRLKVDDELALTDSQYQLKSSDKKLAVDERLKLVLQIIEIDLDAPMNLSGEEEEEEMIAQKNLDP